MRRLSRIARRRNPLLVALALSTVGVTVAPGATPSGCRQRTPQEATVCQSFALLRTAHRAADSPPLSDGSRRYLRSKRATGMRLAIPTGALGWYLAHGPHKSCGYLGPRSKGGGDSATICDTNSNVIAGLLILAFGQPEGKEVIAGFLPDGSHDLQLVIPGDPAVSGPDGTAIIPGQRTLKPQLVRNAFAVRVTAVSGSGSLQWTDATGKRHQQGVAT
ncbi:MAG: hypothetical protein JWM47_4312 [Acidimicrobiales bacterium]|nr:hypothetical protein [Acidimicrobiales bacterium]